MIWLAWRQYRRQLLFTGLALAVLAAVMIPTGLAMRDDFARLGIDACLAKTGDAKLVVAARDGCAAAIGDFSRQWRMVSLGAILFLFLPLLGGIFWGSPLVARELEEGTHRLVWTQGISRRRWSAVKFGLAATVAVVSALVLGLGVTWWFAPLSRTGSVSRMNELLFDVQGLAPVGYTLFAVAIGILAGTIWHKVVPAMAFTVAVAVVAHAAVLFLARPHYLPPEEISYPVRSTAGEYNELRGDWILEIGVRSADGVMLLRDGMLTCTVEPQAPGGAGGCRDGVAADAYNWLKIQPKERFWMLQVIETGILALLAVVMFLLAFRRVRRLA